MKIQPAGQRRHRVTILKRTVTTVNLESQITYTPLETRWASIEPLTAKELLNAQASQIYASTTHKIGMSYTPELHHQDQLQFGTRTFELTGEPINIEERNIDMVVMATEIK